MAATLKAKGISVEVIDLRTIKPLDIATIKKSVEKTHFAVIVEEGHLFTGIASEVAFQIQDGCFESLDAPIARVCQRETPMAYSKALEKETMPTVERILKTIETTLSRKI